MRSLHKNERTPYSREGVGPGQHALVTGLRGLPHAGDDMTVSDTELIVGHALSGGHSLRTNALIHSLHDGPQVVANEDRARKVSAARKARAVEYRRLRSISALHSQRSKEVDKVGEVMRIAQPVCVCVTSIQLEW